MGTTKSAIDTSNPEDFSAEIVQHIPALRRFAKVLTRSQEAAADLTQETLAKAWQARRAFRAGTNLKAWLFTIMRNQFRSEMRRAGRQVPWNEEAAQHIAAPGDEQDWYIELGDAAQAIGLLSKRQRDALILVGVGGLSSADVGVIVQCRPSVIRNRVSRARQAIRLMLDGTEPLKTNRNEKVRGHIDGLVQQLERLTANAA